MLSNLIYVGCIVVWFFAAYASFFTSSGSISRHALDMFALTLLIVVIVLSAGARERFELPSFAPRRLRLTLYWTVLITSIAADFEWPLHSSAQPCHSSVTLFLAAMIVSPLLSAEGEAQRRERAARA